MALSSNVVNYLGTLHPSLVVAYRPRARQGPSLTISIVWRYLQEAGFGGEHPPGFVAGVLRKFIWQVKRKMLNLPVTNHLMPILSGPQGKGKSTFLMRFLPPVEEVAIPSDSRWYKENRRTRENS